MKDKDEPNNLAKKNKSIEEGVSHLMKELNSLEEKTKTVQGQLTKEQKINQEHIKTKEELKKENEDKQKKIRDLDGEVALMGRKQKELNANIVTESGRKVEIENDIQILKQHTKKKLQEDQNRLNKEIDNEKKVFKKIEYENNNLVNNIKEIDTQL